MYKDFWVNFFKIKPFAIYFIQNYVFDNLSSEKIDEFVKKILSREHLKSLSNESMETLKIKYSKYMHIFRENLAHMGYSIILLRKELEEIDPELFTSHRIN